MDTPIDDIDAEGLSDLLNEGGELPVLLADPADVIDYANLHTYEDCETQLVSLIQSRDKNAFAMGDVLAAFEVNRGAPLDADATLTKLATTLGCLPSQLSMWRAVAIFFPKPSREFEMLRWSHYYLAMRRSDGSLQNALELLAYASDNELSVSRFRSYLNAGQDNGDGQDSPDAPAATGASSGYAVVTGTGSVEPRPPQPAATDSPDGRVTLETPAGLVDADTGEIIASAHVFAEGAARGNEPSSSQAHVGANQSSKSHGDLPPGVAEYELYTPEWLIVRVRQALGGEIDLDPASCLEANKVVRANRFFDLEADGLTQPWVSTGVWTNHPYGNGRNQAWAEKIVREFTVGGAMKILSLVPAAVGAPWFQLFADFPRCHLSQRLAFWGPADKDWGPRFDSVVFNLGVPLDQFAEAFEDVGHIYVRYVRGANGSH